MNPLSWLYVDMNSFFASCEQKESPHLEGKPVAVVPSFADTTCCLAASYEAKKFGVKTGVLVSEAKIKCPGIHLVKARHSVYTKYHHQIHKIIEDCIHVEKICSIDEFACRLTGSDQQPEKAKRVALQIKEALRKEFGTAIRCSIGVSTNRLLAKMAADMKKPDGLTVMQEDQIFQRLSELQLQDVPGIGRNMEARLRQKGVSEMKQLLQSSEREMRILWGGVWGERMFYWLRGDDFDLEEPESSSLGHQHVLPPNLRSNSKGYGVAKELLEKAMVRLRRKGVYAKRLHLQVKLLGTPPVYLEGHRRFHETQDTLALLHELESLWKNFPKSMKPFRVSVTLSEFVRASEHQLSLFENPRREALSHVVDYLQKKLGDDRINFGAFLRKSEGQDKEKLENFIAFQHIPEG